MDRAFWLEYGDRLMPGPELWTSNRTAADIFGLFFVNGAPGADAPSDNAICVGGNSGFQALSCALLWGAESIILLGYDMKRSGRAAHWHRDHINLGNPRAIDFKNWIGNFAVLASQVSVPILNASRETALSCFPKIDLFRALGLTSVTPSPNEKPPSRRASCAQVIGCETVSPACIK